MHWIVSAEQIWFCCFLYKKSHKMLKISLNWKFPKFSKIANPSKFPKLSMESFQNSRKLSSPLHPYSYTLTRWSVGHVSRQPNHWAINRILWLWDWTKSRLFLYKGIHGYCFINMQNLESGSDLWDCNNRLHYSSVPVNQLFNTKNSFLQLPTSKTTLKCKVLFKSEFSRTSFIKLFNEMLN